jgi:hypothetical protein
MKADIDTWRAVARRASRAYAAALQAAGVKFDDVAGDDA